jgi:integrase
MPTRAEIRAEHERNAQRAARGADDSALAALNEAPLAQLSTFGASTMKQVVGIHRKFTDWAHSVYTLEELDPEEVLAPNSKIKLTYGHITAFLLSSLSQMKGRSGDDGDQLKFDSAILYWEGFRTCYTYYTGKSLPKDLCVQVRGYVRDELPVKLDLSKDPPSRPFVPFAIFTLMVRYLLSSAMAWITTRQRWQSLAGLAILLNTGMRGGSIWRSLNEEIDKEDLLWGGLTLSIYKNEEDQGDGPNRLVLRFMAPNGKTANARNTEAVITQTTEHWNDALLYILILAHGAGALPTDWTIEQMYDPGIFHSIDQAVLHLSFNQKQEPVFVKQRTELLPDKRAWTVKQFRDAMGRVCQKMGLARTVTAHVIRRSVHLALKMSGEWQHCYKRRLRLT